jgi:hypothetical protein
MSLRSILKTSVHRRAHVHYPRRSHFLNTALGSDGQGPKGSSFIFLDLFDFLIFLLTWREHAWLSWSVRRGVFVRVRMDRTIAH